VNLSNEDLAQLIELLGRIELSDTVEYELELDADTRLLIGGATRIRAGRLMSSSVRDYRLTIVKKRDATGVMGVSTPPTD
jgi:hypothetical protein